VDFGTVADGATRVSRVTQDERKGCSLKGSKCILKTEVRSAQQYPTDTVCQVNFLKLRITLPYQELCPTKFRNPSTIYTSRQSINLVNTWEV
jgi:hypothetical protein